MIQAIRQRVRIQAGGRIEVVAPELHEGMEAEVIVLLPETPHQDTQSSQAAIAQAQALIRQHVPAGVSLSEELIAERRAESERE
ncbi:AbrB/MazE/SpoVT family DNA-binding domain-containing protein [Pleurocapsales cyanobacterium LEGE 06147]|nr:AbrB/MazE/SpoVT family DNA-binding domain-containing protein [Pleurocapsales cyanobacterium LEGE 06147]